MQPSDPATIIPLSGYGPAGGPQGATFAPVGRPRRGRAAPAPAGGQGAQGAPLGRSAEFASGAAERSREQTPHTVDTAPEGPSERLRRAARRRYHLQHIMQKVLQQHRTCDCMRGMAGEVVEVRYHPASGGASYGQLVTCGNAWVCPVCSAKVLTKRAEELAAAVKIWQDRGNHLLMLTLTLRHERGTALESYLEGLNEAYRRLTSGRAWQDFKKAHGLAGAVVRREITTGRAGWHPHLHGLMFFEGKATRESIEQIEKYLKKRWVYMLQQIGFDASEERGADLRRAGDGADEYISKISSMWSTAKEISSADTKRALHGNKTIAQLLFDAEAGSTSAPRLLREYAEATKRKSVLRWSPGLRTIIFGSEEHKTDEELAAEEGEEAVTLAVLTRPQWARVCELELRGQLLAAAVGGDVGRLALWAARRGLGLEEWQIGYDCWHRSTKPRP